jgi:hypothetical protein
VVLGRVNGWLSPPYQSEPLLVCHRFAKRRGPPQTLPYSVFRFLLGRPPREIWGGQDVCGEVHAWGAARRLAFTYPHAALPRTPCAPPRNALASTHSP